MPGLREDQIQLYNKDMYKAERDVFTKADLKYPKIYKVVKATGAGDKKTQILSAGQLEKHTVEGQNIKMTNPVSGWTSQVVYSTYSAGLNFTPEAVEDTVKLGNVLKDVAAGWGDEHGRAKETHAASPFNNGGTLAGHSVFNGSFVGNADASGNLLYDGKPLFNLTGNRNTTKGGGTYYNSVAADYAAGAITASHFSDLYNLMTGINNRNEQDLPTVNQPDTVICKPGADHDSIWTVLNSDLLAGSPNNDKNVQRGRIKQIIAWDYITEAAFYVGKSQSDMITFEERLAPQIKFFSDNNNDGYCATIRARFGVHFKPGSRRLWVRGGGTSA